MALLANKLAPALAAGNCAVIKPSEFASVTTLEFAALISEAGFPAGTVNVVTGDGATGAALVDHPAIRKVSFTGGNVGGQLLVNLAPPFMCGFTPPSTRGKAHGNSLRKHQVKGLGYSVMAV